MSVTIDEVLRRARPVLPVLVIDEVSQAVELARALSEGGLQVLEVTLRTPHALDALSAIRRELPDLLVGAGTLIHAGQFAQARDAGAQFAVSPGFTERLGLAAEASGLAYLPGVMTASEVLGGLECGYRAFKLFPAEGASSLSLLKSFQGPFAGLRFCPTGGVSADNLQSFMRLPNVACVGGTWVTPAAALRACDWPAITELARQARELAACVDIKT